MYFSEPGQYTAAEDIICEYKKKDIGESKQRNFSYSADIMKWAITLQGYSSKGYNFVRDTFAKCIPSKKTISRHLSKLDANPGIRNSPFWLIRQKVEENKNKLFLSVAVDDISIRNDNLFLTTYFVCLRGGGGGNLN